VVAREHRSRSTLEPREWPLRELDQRREHFAGSEVVITPEGAGALTLAVLGVEGQPDRLRELTLGGRETQILLVGLDAVPPVLGVALGGVDQVPQVIERVRHVQEQHFGHRPGSELLGRLGQAQARPELTGACELLLGRDIPGRNARHVSNRRVHRGGQARLLDDASDVAVREACRGEHTLELDLLTDGGVVEASHDGSLPSY